jgi:hypothetical protein
MIHLRQGEDPRADRNAVIEVDDVFVRHAIAAGGGTDTHAFVP